MRIKRIILSAVSLILTLSFILTLSSCFGEKKDETPSGGALTLFDGSDADYTIIYATDVTNTLRVSILELKAAIEEITGKTVNVSSDTSKSYKEKDREIIIGRTTRSQSETAIGKLESVGYRYDRIDDKITLVGTNDYLTAKAVDAFLSSLTVEGNKISAASDLAYFKDCSDEMLSLINDKGEFAYDIIVAKESSELYNVSYDFKGWVEELFNKDGAHSVRLKVKYDTAVPVTAGAREILVGKTNRENSKSLYSDIGYFAYRLFNEGDSILVGAYKESVAVSAMNELYQYVKEAYVSSTDGNCWIPKGFDVKDEAYGWTNQLPNVRNATFDGIYDPNDGTQLIRYVNADENIYTAYLSALKNAGFTQEKSYTMGQNSYSLHYGAEMNTYVSYIKNTGEIRVFLEKTGTQYPTALQSSGSGSYTPKLWQLRVDNYGSRENGGMSYVLQMSNGNFLIVDGGYNTEEEADHLYTFLKSKTPEGQKPIIEGWFISHLHGDHYGAFLAFSNKYNETHVELKAMYWNFLDSKTQEGVASYAVAQIESGARKWSGVKLYTKMHTGMTVEFAGANVSILCTHEDVYPSSFIDANDTSTVYRFEVAGQKVIFLGDCRDNECAAMLRSFGEDSSELKADIVQWSHHGYEGATYDMYSAIGAHTVLFPMNVVGWQEKNYTDETSDPNPNSIVSSWINNYRIPCGRYLAENTTVKNIIIAGMDEQNFCNSHYGVKSGKHCGTAQELVLPYTPKNLGKTGSALVSYYVDLANTYYNNNKDYRGKHVLG